MLWPHHQPPIVSALNYRLTQTLCLNALLLSCSLHPSYDNMHKQIQSELKSLPEHCPPYGLRRESFSIQFPFHHIH